MYIITHQLLIIKISHNQEFDGLSVINTRTFLWDFRRNLKQLCNYWHKILDESYSMIFSVDTTNKQLYANILLFTKSRM